MMESESTHRVVFARQPARIFMVDLNRHFDMDICYCLNQALGCFMTLASNLAGPSRVPFFGLFVLTNKCEILLPLQCTKGGNNSLQQALSQLQTICNSYNSTETITDSCLTEALQTAISQYRKQSQLLIQSSGYWCQLEVFLVTCQDGMKLARHAESDIRDRNLGDIKKLQVVVLSSPEHYGFNLQLSGLSQSSDGSTNMDTSSNVDGVVDVIKVNADPLSLDHFFKAWMQDGGTEKEHMYLILPPSSAGEQELVIKCDVHERFLNPALLPYLSAYICLYGDKERPFQICLNRGHDILTDILVDFQSLQIDTSLCRPGAGMVNKQGGFTVPVHKLRVLNQIHGDQMCESVLYGMPLIIKPTACWKLDWDELDNNQQYFQSICRQLLQKNTFLLCKLEDTNPTAPHGYFVILPSNTSTLLLKSVAVSELMLPCTLPTLETASSDVTQNVTNSLQNVKMINEFNPLQLNSGLYEALQRSHNKEVSAKTKYKRGGPQALQQGSQLRKGFSHEPVFRSAKSLFPTSL